MNARGTVLLLAIGLMASCGKDKTTGPKVDDITGNWNATKVEYVSRATPATRMDIVAAGGSGTLALNPDNSFVMIVTEVGEPPDTSTATWTLNDDEMKVQPTGVSWYWVFKVQLSGDALALTGGSAEYDFDDDGAGEQAELNLALVR